MKLSQVGCWALGLSAMISSAASAAMMPLGSSGYTASWSDSFKDLQLIYQSENSDTLYLRLVDTYGPADWNADAGQLNPHGIVFLSTSPTPKAFIVIEDLQITNNSGYNWGGWQINLLGVGSLLAPDDGDSLNKSSLAQAPTPLLIQGATSIGQALTLKQFPVDLTPVPEPGALGLVAAAGLLLRRRR